MTGLMPGPVFTPAPKPGRGPLVQARGLSKGFGAVQALRGVSLDLARSQCVGIVGHNGAGKSTLMNVLCGTLGLDAGTLQVGGVPAGGAGWSVRAAQRLGVRRVFQELSLCLNLSLAENMHVALRQVHGRGWRQHAAALLMEALDRIFPGHGLRPGQVLADLPIGARQMVEIARAFTPGPQEPLELMILDEPTSALDPHAARQLLAHVRRFVVAGGACVFITHKLGEVFEVADRVLVMRDGQVVDDQPVAATHREALLAAMGQAESGGAPAVAVALSCAEPVAWVQSPALQVRRGEVVGLAGLAGHGQTDMLRVLLRAAGQRGKRLVHVPVEVAFVAGDRQSEGLFPLWSIERNMSLGWLASLRRQGLIDPARERAEVQRWQQQLGLATPDVGMPVLSLSGGNQQKVLFARALGSAARLVLMDDPMRGVDVGTKHDMCRLIAAEARSGRSFVWYSTDLDELHHCDRVYVFRQGRIAGELTRSEFTEERVLALSFEDAA